LASNQVQYSLLHRQPETDGVLDACHELGVTDPLFMRLASGALTGKYSPTTHPAGWRQRMGYVRDKNALGAGELARSAARDRGAPREEPQRGRPALFIQLEGVLPIPGAKNASQATGNAGALTFTLEPDEVDARRRHLDRPEDGLGE
jgi:aryl-alcohol dehydrogenase-like predicted oxidoreductase